MSDETNTTEQQPAAATADAALTPLAITETSVANEIARIERIMRIGFPVQVVFRDGRTFNGSYVQAGIVVGGQVKGGKALANIRVLTDAAPGEHPDLPRFCSIPHVLASSPEDAVIWRTPDDDNLGGWLGNEPATNGPQAHPQDE
jgi:hypothetical protein